MAVDLRHLRAFLAIAQERNITRAAAMLRVSQPALSRTLRQLEDHLGVRLVHRTTHELSLTEAGRSLQVRAAAAAAAVDAALDPAVVAAWPLRLGHAWSALGDRTTLVLRRWQETYPEIPLQLKRIDEEMAGLTRGRVDVAVLRHAVRRPGIQTVFLRQEARVVTLAAGHPLAGRTDLALTDLADATIALNTVSGSTTLDLWPAAARPERTLSAANTEDWLAVIAADDAVGVTSCVTADLQTFPGVVYRPLIDAAPIDVHLAWPSTPVHPATADLVDLIQQVVGAGST